MTSADWVTIVPEYLTEYDPEVVEFIKEIFSESEIPILRTKLVEVFNQSIIIRLKENFTYWLSSSLAKNQMGQVEAGKLIGVNHSTISRWINGKTDIPLKSLQTFYLHFGGENEFDNPFIPLPDLNFNAYRLVVSYMRLVLEEGKKAGLRGKENANMYRIFKIIDNSSISSGNMNPNKVLWLNYFFSKKEVGNIFDQGVYEKFKKWLLLRGLYQNYHLLDDRFVVWGTYEQLNYDLDHWSKPWLMSVRFLAENFGGVSEFSISALRPARFSTRRKKHES